MVIDAQGLSVCMCLLEYRSMEPLVFAVRFGEFYGWADIRIRSAEQEIVAESSYISDPLTMIARGLARLCQEQDSVEVLCDTESDGFWLLLFRRDQNEFQLTVNWGSGLNDIGPARQRPARLRHKGDWFVDCATILAAFIRLRDEFGEDGYKARWGYPYPAKEIAAIQAALANTA